MDIMIQYYELVLSGGMDTLVMVCGYLFIHKVVYQPVLCIIMHSTTLASSYGYYIRSYMMLCTYVVSILCTICILASIHTY